MTPTIWICIGLALGFLLGIFTGALMCIRKVSEADYEYAKLHDKHIKMVKEFQDYIQGVEHGSQ